MKAAATPSQTARMSRDQIIALGQANRPWEFLPICCQALRVAPDDLALRLLAAANLARLGLRTAAGEHLDALPEVALQEQAVRDLRIACRGLPDDRISWESSVATCRANLEVLVQRRAFRGVSDGELFAQFETWQHAREEERFRSLDGNIVSRSGGEWRLLADHRGAAERFAQEHLAPGPDGRARPVASLYTLEGLCPPWMLLELAEHAPRQPEGFWPRIAVVQADANEFFEGLACCDLREVLGQDRLDFYIGCDASAHLAAHLRQRDEAQISGPCIPLPSTRRLADPPVLEVLEKAQRAQLEEHRRLVAEVEAMYRGRDRQWWRDRFEKARAAASERCETLRVLIPTCRYSTYVQHSSRELAESLNAAGFDAHVLIEPDDSTRMSSLAYLRAIRSFQPDLIIVINYFRAHLGEWFPRSVPYVCWIQDDLPHMYEARIGAAQGELDFVVGHLHRELFERFGFPRVGTLSFPVVVSSTRFHGERVSPELRARYECEVALVSHHSEPPERMHERLIQNAGDPRAAQILERLYPAVVAIGEDPMDIRAGDSVPRRDQVARLSDEVAAAIREASGREPDPRQGLSVLRQYALPLAERVLRHQTLRWAVEIARRRNWRLHLYGRGWESVEMFAEFARGEAMRGEDLRAIYQCAGVQLHIAATALVHQRVLECSLSGGLPVCRLTVQGLNTTSSVQPDTAPERCPAWVYGDLSQMSFKSSEELEGVTQRAIDDPAWRQAMSSGMASRVRQRLTNEVFIERIMDLVCARSEAGLS